MKIESKRWRKAFPLAAAMTVAALVGVPAWSDDMGGGSGAEGSGPENSLSGLSRSERRAARRTARVARHAKLAAWMSEKDKVDGATMRDYRRYAVEQAQLENLYFKAAYLELADAFDIEDGLLTYRKDRLPKWAVPDFEKLQATLEPANLHIQRMIGRVEPWTTGKDFMEAMKSFDPQNAVKYTFPQEVTDPNFSQSQSGECEYGDENCFIGAQERN